MAKLESQLISNGLHGDYVHRDKVKQIAEVYHQLRGLEGEKLKTLAEVLKLCLRQLNEPDPYLSVTARRDFFKRRRELIAGLPNIIKMLEGGTE